MDRLSKRHCDDDVREYYKYIIKCPCCGTILSISKNDVYRTEDYSCIHHEYVKCCECNEEIQLPDEEYYGY